MINYNEFETQMKRHYKSGYLTGLAIGIVLTSIFYVGMLIMILAMS